MKLFYFLFAITITVSSYSQSFEKNFIDQNYIEVIGTAEMKIIPDEIYLKIVINQKDYKNKEGLKEIEAKIISLLSSIGIKTKNLSVSDASSRLKNYWIKNKLLSNREYEILVSNSKIMEDLIAGLEKTNVSNISIDRVSHSKIEQLRKEVKIKAIKSAKEKGTLLTNAIDQKIGRAIHISELSGANYINSNSLMRETAYSGRYAARSAREPNYSSIDFEKITLKSFINVKFILE